MKPKTLSPILTAKGVRLAIAVGRFNERVTKLLLEGALEAYARLGGDPAEVLVAWVPGSFELPLQAMLQTEKPIVFGVLPTTTPEEAQERAGGKAGNKGAEAVFTAIEMVRLLEAISR